MRLQPVTLWLVLLLVSLLAGCAGSGAGAHVSLSAPATLVATPADKLVTLDWRAVSEATGYAIYRGSTSGGPYSKIGSTIGSVFIDNTVSDGATYYYVVRSVLGSRESGNSPEASTTPESLPATPGGLSATPADGAVGLAWTASSRAASYSIARSTSADGSYSEVATVTSTQYTDSGLTNGTAYYYTVTAVNGVGKSAASKAVEAIPIAAPANLSAIANDGQVALFWNAVAGASSYTVESLPGCGGAATALASTTANRYLATGLGNGTSYAFEVVATNSTGSSAPSACVVATPSASSTVYPPAEDESRNYLGLGTWYLNDWDTSYAFADALMHARYWMNASWSQAASVDALGWPTEDASTVVLTADSTFSNGAYTLTFKGQADLGLMWINGTITNQSYDAATNTTTATVTINMTDSGSNSWGLYFNNTRRTATSATGTGFTDAHLYRPGYASDGSAVFTTPFLTALSRAGTVRMMDWSYTNANFVENWAERVTPYSGTQGGLPNSYTDPGGGLHSGQGGVALEYQIMLCNQLMVDCYINIPVVANDDFVTNMALTLAFGSDGSNPYTAKQSNPVFAPLNPALHLYLEYGNEIWNSSAELFSVVQAICENLPSTHPIYAIDASEVSGNVYYAMWRYPAWRMAGISQIFRSVFGADQMMRRVRPVLMTQQGDGQASLDVALQWLNDYAATLSGSPAVSDLIWGGGGSAYYEAINNQSSLPDSFFAADNYPDPSVLKNWAIDSMWLKNYGLHHMSYEGGPGLSFTDAANDTLNADARMQTMVEKYHDAWSAMGGELAIYYNLTGPSNWEFTPLITNSNTPKLNALTALAASPRAAVTLGAALPGSLNYADESGYIIHSSNVYGYDTTTGGMDCTAINQSNAYAALPAHADSAFTGTLTITGNANQSTPVDAGIWINGSYQGSVTLPADADSQTADTSSALTVSIPAGVSVIRLSTAQNGYIFCGLKVVAR